MIRAWLVRRRKRREEAMAVRAAAEARNIVKVAPGCQYYDAPPQLQPTWYDNEFGVSHGRPDHLHRYVYRHPLTTGGVGWDEWRGRWYGWIDCGGMPSVYEGGNLNAAMYHVEQGYRWLKGGDMAGKPGPYEGICR